MKRTVLLSAFLLLVLAVGSPAQKTDIQREGRAQGSPNTKSAPVGSLNACNPTGEDAYITLVYMPASGARRAARSEGWFHLGPAECARLGADTDEDGFFVFAVTAERKTVTVHPDFDLLDKREMLPGPEITACAIWPGPFAISPQACGDEDKVVFTGMIALLAGEFAIADFQYGLRRRPSAIYRSTGTKKPVAHPNPPPARGLLGAAVQDLTKEMAGERGPMISRLRRGMQSLGALVVNVVPGGPASKAGLRPGDVIIEIDSRSIYNAADLVSSVSLRGAGAEAKIGYLPGGTVDRKTASVTLGQRPPVR